MDCLIFDFDGVIVDSEPVHLVGFQQVLAGAGISLTSQEYYQRYLGYDDHDCFAAVLRDRGRPVSEPQIRQMTADKTVLVQRAFSQSIQPMPGARELIRAAAQRKIPMAVCSGALRAEIRMAAQAVGVLDSFDVIVSAEDVRAGKPDPQGYLLAFERLQQLAGRRLSAGRSVVIEDSPAGIEAARLAGMAVLAVAGSYPPSQLRRADRVVASLAEADPDLLESLVAGR